MKYNSANKAAKGSDTVARVPKVKISRISAIHFFKLVFRSVLFVTATVFYILKRSSLYRELSNRPMELIVLSIVFVVEMVLRFFPSKFESMGCQKQFARNFKETGNGAKPQNLSWGITLAVAGVWLALNAVIGALFFTGVIDEGILLLVCLFYSVCDMICILFYCPFQSLFMKNKCCTSCRIYNWDYAMMFTPLIFLINPANPLSFFLTLMLLLGALALLIRWEVTFALHPERFSEKTNACLECANCKEKLCTHKKHLQFMMKKYKWLYKKEQ